MGPWKGDLRLAISGEILGIALYYFVVFGTILIYMGPYGSDLRGRRTVNESRVREAVWAAAFVQRWRDDPQVFSYIAKDCAEYADRAVQLFELAMASASEATAHMEDFPRNQCPTCLVFGGDHSVGCPRST